MINKLLRLSIIIPFLIILCFPILSLDMPFFFGIITYSKYIFGNISYLDPITYDMMIRQNIMFFVSAICMIVCLVLLGIYIVRTCQNKYFNFKYVLLCALVTYFVYAFKPRSYGELVYYLSPSFYALAVFLAIDIIVTRLTYRFV